MDSGTTALRRSEEVLVGSDQAPLCGPKWIADLTTADSRMNCGSHEPGASVEMGQFMVFRRTRRLLVSIVVATTVLTSPGAADALAAVGSVTALTGHPPMGALDAVTYDASTDTIVAR